ncbi:unnamed protein product [Echinostoma caproni]|uniref:Uncharacterized protein n=1 Tax=Echinostoma caproni TaxID=27848 RepID=A0A183B0C9_9TREM|nr:unnamed protein product [Echinostoma caproni]
MVTRRHSSAEVHANVHLTLAAGKQRVGESQNASTSHGVLSTVSTPSSVNRRPSDTAKRGRRFFPTKTNSMFIGSTFTGRPDSSTVERGVGGIVINTDSGAQSRRNVSDKVAEALCRAPVSLSSSTEAFHRSTASPKKTELIEDMWRIPL